MSDIVLLVGSGVPATDRATLNANDQANQENFRSATAPANPRAGQWWVDSSGAFDVVKIRNRANSAWVIMFADASVASGGCLPLTGGTMSGAIAMGSQKITGLADGTAAGDAINKGQADGRRRTDGVKVGTLAVADNAYIFIVPTGGATIVDVEIVSELSVASSGVNYWDFQVRNLTAAVNLRSAVKSTNGAAITADTTYPLGLDQNITPAAAAVLQLQITRTGAPANLQELFVVVHYKVAT